MEFLAIDCSVVRELQSVWSELVQTLCTIILYWCRLNESKSSYIANNILVVNMVLRSVAISPSGTACGSWMDCGSSVSSKSRES